MFKARFVDRSKINLSHPYEVKAWTQHLSVDRSLLEQLVAKVGNSSAAVKKELTQ